MQFTQFTGNYVLHCHILTHEDQGMMAYFKVQGKEGTLWPGALDADPKCYQWSTAQGSGAHFTWYDDV